jgi:septum formation protein
MAGLSFEIFVESVVETPLVGESPEALVSRLSLAKAKPVARRFPDRYVLGADTVVFGLGEIFGKPTDDEDAVRMLLSLQGREHEVISGFSIVREDRFISLTRVCRTSVKMIEVSEEKIRRYVATGEPRDKAGGYAIQGGALFFISEIRGSYSNVIGLPLVEVIKELEQLEAI